MTKQEIIQEAYGEYWDLVKNNVNENGWVESGYFDTNTKLIKVNDNFKEKKETNYDQRNSNYIIWRPLSLQGIENNNGWIKIESDDDLPKEEDDYHICIENKDLSIAYFDKSDGWFIACPEITHYQQITKPKPPTY